MSLNNPLIVLRRNEKGEFEMVSIIKNKILFRSRPTPLSPKSGEKKISEMDMMPPPSPDDIKPKKLFFGKKKK